MLIFLCMCFSFFLCIIFLLPRGRRLYYLAEIRLTTIEETGRNRHRRALSRTVCSRTVWFHVFVRRHWNIIATHCTAVLCSSIMHVLCATECTEIAYTRLFDIIQRIKTHALLWWRDGDSRFVFISPGEFFFFSPFVEMLQCSLVTVRVRAARTCYNMITLFADDSVANIYVPISYQQ